MGSATDDDLHQGSKCTRKRFDLSYKFPFFAFQVIVLPSSYPATVGALKRVDVATELLIDWSFYLVDGHGELTT